MEPLLLALDQGTTSTRAILFGPALAPRATASQELPQHFPAPGWVEHEPEDIWQGALATLRAALAQGGAAARDLAGIGITNQRETVVLWERASGRPVHRAIVWQDRRTTAACAALRESGQEALITRRTGLLADPYFSATKLAWLLDHVSGARAQAERGELAFGTVDSFLLWRLTGGRVHATDATNAARTLLFDITRGAWDDDLLRLFGIPRAILPEVRDCAAEFGTTTPEILGAPVPIRGIAGDQQAATMGQACFAPGMLKSTYGTGCFALLNTGATPVFSRHRLLTTIAWQLGGARTYALEGAIFVAGATVQWLRDGLGLIGTAAETGMLAQQADPAQAVYLVPGFVGLGAPWWDAEARGAIFGLTRNTGRAELARAALESVAFQTRDLLDAMAADIAGEVGVAASGTGDTMVLRVDGGMVASDWTMQFLADVLGAPVDRPTVMETTALGAAWLAGLQAGIFPPPGGAGDVPRAFGATHWRLERRFLPQMAREEAARRHAGWLDAVRRTRSGG
ncbi:glycerol kinase [Siccirubricoccus deserti]|uniref:Glycerol kinase n=1 Tax=Siccirubricoccus deserti TaxID=2013562 RepID=A0A9X0QWU8_9PROT|nr:glycerol kinase GlpK [Siccirubricoccus deserti]MBC4014057.1 glycerol kinase GlpK [Siccirubricoccus deserti]GGC26129.1 glycerol kinase [Siccirubricoccus deserti]